MIPKSIAYKLVRKSDNVIIAEGSKKEMLALMKKTPGTFLGLSSSQSRLGEVF